MKQILTLSEPIGKITKSADLFDKIKKIKIDYSQENLLVFYLDIGNKLISSEIVFKGGLNSCLICPKTLYRKALINNANALILGHNHPSGCLTPSDEDIKIKEIITEAGEMLQIKVLDFLIFNKKEYYQVI